LGAPVVAKVEKVECNKEAFFQYGVGKLVAINNKA